MRPEMPILHQRYIEILRAANMRGTINFRTRDIDTTFSTKCMNQYEKQRVLLRNRRRKISCDDVIE